MSNNNKSNYSERISRLSPLEYQITQERSTEKPFSNKYNRHWETGTYRCLICNAELFKSNTKFESKSGWPAFYNVVDPKRVKLKADLSHVGANLLLLISKPDLARTEVSCANCNAHLGHLFKDGPKPTGLRYCINSSSLQFVPDDNGDNGNSEEFPCNPQNSCSQSLPVTPAAATLPTTLPPMGSLCLNNRREKEEVSTPVFEKCVGYNKTQTNSSRGSSSKNFSFTAARVNFFQNLEQNRNVSNSRANGRLDNAKISSISSPPTPVRETSL